MLENVKLAGYESPTPIQKYTIPSILQGFDVIGVAQTGKPGRLDNIVLRISDSPWFRFRQDWSIPDPHSQQVDGKSKETCRSPP
jgi:hypothetical protein